jgi:hypothetical protein
MARRKKGECEKAQELRNIWSEFASLYYAGRLNEPTSVRVVEKLTPSKDGNKTWAMIVRHPNGHIHLKMIAEAWDVHPDWVRACTLHEMIHHHIGISRPHDGDAWNAEIRRLSELGALRHVV